MVLPKSKFQCILYSIFSIYYFPQSCVFKIYIVCSLGVQVIPASPSTVIMLCETLLIAFEYFFFYIPIFGHLNLSIFNETTLQSCLSLQGLVPQLLSLQSRHEQYDSKHRIGSGIPLNDSLHFSLSNHFSPGSSNT